MFSNICKTRSARFLYVLSLAMGITSVVILILSGHAIDDHKKLAHVGKQAYTDPSIVVYGLSAAGGILGIVIAIMTFLTAKYQNFVLACPLSICSLSVAMMCLSIVGVIYGSGGEHYYNGICNTA